MILHFVPLFVVGIHIETSTTNHTCKGVKGVFVDICDELAGDYPKDFKWTGWHPHCRCHATPIMKTEDEILADNERIMRGEEPSEGSVNEVKEMPKAMMDWAEANKERAARGVKMPYFVEDNRRVSMAMSNKEKQSGHIETEGTPTEQWRVKQTMQNCGISQEKAVELNKAIHTYSLDRETGWDSDVRRFQLEGNKASTKNNIEEVEKVAKGCEEFIRLSPKWDGGPTFRGLGVPQEVIDNWVSLTGSGEEIDMRGMSSWSTNPEKAQGFAEKYATDGNVKAVFVCAGQQYGTSIKHLAKYPEECEVLCSNISRWRIDEYSFDEENGIYVFKVSALF